MQIININQFLKYLVYPFALVYGIIIICRNSFYNLGFFKSYKLPCTVISVGNLTVGGTGKTPTVIFLAKYLQKKNKKVTILSRGFGRSSRGTILVTDGNNTKYSWQEVGDEPYLMAKLLNGVPIIVDKNRVRGGMFAIKNFNTDIILLDDGFQHRSIIRDLDFVLINSRDKQSDHNLIPSGILREPWLNIDRSSAIILTKSNIYDPQPFLLTKIKKTQKPLIKSTIQLSQSSLQDKTKLNIAQYTGAKVAIISAIGDNTGFYNSVTKYGFEIVCEITFPDHFHYTINTLQKINNKVIKSDAELIITTEKDWIKIDNFNFDQSVIVMGLSLNLEPKDKLKKLLKPFV